MAELRITWSDCLRNGACLEALPTFQRAAIEHGDGTDIVLPDGWTEEHVRICLAYPGGAWCLSFLEEKDLVPVVASDAKVFPLVLAGQRAAIDQREALRAKRA